MRFLFCYFSATGNTRRVMEQLAAGLEAEGHEAELFAIRAGSEAPSPSGYDALAIGYPVHAFNAPAPVLEFLKRLPACEGKEQPVYLVRTSGEPLKLNDAAGILPARILKRAGYSVRGEFSYVMPYNIIFRHSDGMAARMWRAVLLRAPRDAGVMAAGGGSRPKTGVFRRIVSFALRIEHTAMPLVGRHFKTTKECIGCGLCAKVCPQGNITMKGGKPKFGKTCAACMGCAFSCPKDAIKISLLNGWRVNGAYPLDGVPATDEEVCDYCKRAYLNYFAQAERIAPDARTGEDEDEEAASAAAR